MEVNTKRMEELIEKLNKFSYDYYVLDNPTISDSEYDKLYDELIKLETETGIVMKDSPTQRVGDVILEEFKKHVHKGKLLSLNKAQSKEELVEWIIKNEKAIKEHNISSEEKLPKPSYIITKKYDGISINCMYNEHGELESIATRGTGEIGENITFQGKTIKTIPLKINCKSVVEVNGEAVMTQKAFENYNQSATVPLKNLRNGAAGALRNLDIKETKKRNLSAFFYNMPYHENLNFKTYEEMLIFLQENKFPVAEYKVFEDIEDIKNEIDKIESERNVLQYDIDGVVIAINDLKTRNFLGFTIKFPKWAMAYKFEAEEATTTLLDVEWNVGRSGRVAPTAILEPVDLGGITIKRATLNNMDDIKRKDVKIGSRVFVKRSNDVIPFIMGVVDEENENLREIVPPKYCPSCKSELVMEGAHYFCLNSLSCSPQLSKSLSHFASREAMNIEGLSEKTSEKFIENLNLKNVYSLYEIKKEDLLKLPKIKEKSAGNLLSAIEKSKDCSLDSFIYALGIPNVGKKTAKDLSDNFKNLNNLINAEYEDLIKIRDIGEIVAREIVEFFSDKRILENVNKLLELGVKPSFEEVEVEENIFSGKTVVITGTFKNFKRSEIEDMVIKSGGKTSGSVSKKTDFVLVGEDAGSKYTKALELNIRIIEEEELDNLIKSL